MSAEKAFFAFISEPLTKAHPLPLKNQFGGNNTQVLLPAGVSFRANECGNNR